MLFRSKRPKISRSQALAAKPMRAVEGKLDLRDNGTAALKVPLRPAKWTGWFMRVPEGATKTFELDQMGLLVWNQCDGRTSVQQIIRRLAKQYNLNLREAEVPTVSFLQTLAKKGLVAFALPGQEGGALKRGDDR